MPPGTAIRPYANCHFKVKVGGRAVAEFTECSGLEMTVKFEEVREGGENGFVHRLPGRIEYGNLVLRRGYAKTDEFLKWMRTIVNRGGRITRENVTIELLDPKLEPVARWTFEQAYPVKWSGPALRAGETALAVESLELAHRGLLPEGS
jgi:phage tail-like protein